MENHILFRYHYCKEGFILTTIAYNDYCNDTVDKAVAKQWQEDSCQGRDITKDGILEKFKSSRKIFEIKKNKYLK